MAGARRAECRHRGAWIRESLHIHGQTNGELLRVGLQPLGLRAQHVGLRFHPRDMVAYDLLGCLFKFLLLDHRTIHLSLLFGRKGMIFTTAPRWGVIRRLHLGEHLFILRIFFGWQFLRCLDSFLNGFSFRIQPVGLCVRKFIEIPSAYTHGERPHLVGLTKRKARLPLILWLHH